ncbi:MAG: cysteine peptidase family C39 domain-containing protein, partial [Bacteroidota bacterium]
MAKFPIYRQLDQMDCGPTALRMIAKYYGKVYSLQSLREKSFITREGVSLLGISDAAEAIGLRSLAAKVPYQKMVEEAPMPLIAHWRQKHFVVVYGMRGNKLLIADPAHGKITYTKEEFLDGWVSSQEKGQETGVIMLLEPTPEFYKKDDEKGKAKVGSFRHLFSYLTPYRKWLFQLFLG